MARNIFWKKIFNTFTHLIRKKSTCTESKGKHHVSASHVGKLEGKENHRKVGKGTMSPGEQDIAFFTKLLF